MFHWGIWVVQLAEPLTLGLGLGPDLIHMTDGALLISLALHPSPAHAGSLSL